MIGVKTQNAPTITLATRQAVNYDEAVKHGAQQTPTFFVITSDGSTTKIRGAQPYSAFYKVVNPLTSAIQIEQP